MRRALPLLALLGAACASAPGLTAAYERARAATFLVYKDATWDAGRADWVHGGFGSGVGFRADGWILTNTHVIRDARSIVVVGEDGVARAADLWEWDNLIDVAVVHVPDVTLSVADLGRREDLRVGETVFAVGSPRGYERSMTTGVVGGLHRSLYVDGSPTWRVQDYIQTDAQTNPGNSGGGLFDARGRIVGLNSASMSALAAEDIPIPGISFAIPIRHAVAIARRLINSDAPPSHSQFNVGWLRSVDELPDALRREHGITENEGLLVVRVDSWTFGERIGLRPGDWLLAIDGERVANFAHFLALTILRPAGESVVILVRRQGDPVEIEAALEPW